MPSQASKQAPQALDAALNPHADLSMHRASPAHHTSAVDTRCGAVPTSQALERCTAMRLARPQ